MKKKIQYSNCPKISYTIIWYKMAYANYVDPDQLAHSAAYEAADWSTSKLFTIHENMPI